MRKTARVPKSNVKPLIAKLGSTSGLLRKANPWAAEHVPNTRPNTTSAFFRRYFVTCKSFLVVIHQTWSTEGAHNHDAPDPIQSTFRGTTLMLPNYWPEPEKPGRIKCHFQHRVPKGTTPEKLRPYANFFRSSQGILPRGVRLVATEIENRNKLLQDYLKYFTSPHERQYSESKTTLAYSDRISFVSK